jgi:nucleotidyltransferase AbiEii toxin of type IV toxin-antitoxin system
MKEFHPHLEILSIAQARLWRELTALPDQFVLYGGTALALHLGHRNSVDFDFFSRDPLDLSQLEGEIPFLAGAKIVQREKNTLSANVERGDPVKVSFFGVPKLPQLEPAHVVEENNLKVASLLDLAGTKASVIQVRAEAKDYLDLDALMRLGEVDLATALAAAQALYGPTFNPEVTLKALSYFDDGNLRDLPNDLKLRLVEAAREVDLDHLPVLAADFRRTDMDYGLE